MRWKWLETCTEHINNISKIYLFNNNATVLEIQREGNNLTYVLKSEIHGLLNNPMFLNKQQWSKVRSSTPWLFLKKYVLKIYSKFIGGDPCWSVISLKLFYNFIEIRMGVLLWMCCIFSEQLLNRTATSYKNIWKV